MGFSLKELAVVPKVGQDSRQALGLEDSKSFFQIFLTVALRQRCLELALWWMLATPCQREERSMTKSPLRVVVVVNKSFGSISETM